MGPALLPENLDRLRKTEAIKDIPELWEISYADEPLGKKNPYENQADQGMYLLTKNEDDRMFFKVSPLRNVTLTAPYFHDGKIAILEEAVRKMAKLQLDEQLTDQQLNDITSFLKALTDKKRQQYIK